MATETGWNSLYPKRTVKAIARATAKGESAKTIATRLNLTPQIVGAIQGNLARGVYSL